MIVESNIPKISVILPVYNAEKYIKESIESILKQSFGDFELILINDGSNDDSEKEILSFEDSRIRYYLNETNLGLIKTLNKGIAQARGKYVARMDADDICAPNRFEKQFNYLEQHYDVVICGSWAKIIDEFGVVTGRIKRIDTNALIRANMLFTTPFVHPTVMIRKEVLEKNQYNEDAKHCEDLELWVRLSKEPTYKFHNLPEFLLNYRIHSSNVSVINTDYQTEKRQQLIRPYIEKLMGQVTNDELKTHFLTFSPDAVSKSEQGKINAWLVALAKKNNSSHVFEKKSFNALLLSRWFITCIRSKSYFQLLQIGLPWYNLTTLFQSLRLILAK
jgi:glycosyltransferase involved in cell wall biosynthesis